MPQMSCRPQIKFIQSESARLIINEATDPDAPDEAVAASVVHVGLPLVGEVLVLDHVWRAGATDQLRRSMGSHRAACGGRRQRSDFGSQTVGALLAKRTQHRSTRSHS